MLGRRDQRSELLRPLSERSRDSKEPSSRYPFWRGLHFPILKDLCVYRSVCTLLIGEWTGDRVGPRVVGGRVARVALRSGTVPRGRRERVGGHIQQS